MDVYIFIQNLYLINTITNKLSEIIQRLFQLVGNKMLGIAVSYRHVFNKQIHTRALAISGTFECLILFKGWTEFRYAYALIFAHA